MAPAVHSTGVMGCVATHDLPCLKTTTTTTGAAGLQGLVMHCLRVHKCLIAYKHFKPADVIVWTDRPVQEIVVIHKHLRCQQAYHLKRDSTDIEASVQPQMYRAAANASAHDSLQGLPAGSRAALVTGHLCRETFAIFARASLFIPSVCSTCSNGVSTGADNGDTCYHISSSP